MKLKILWVIAAVIIALPIQAFAIETNVAFNKNVTLNGSFFTNGWGSGLVVNKQTVVDGLFFPRATQWDQGPVWWDSNPAQTRGQNIVIDLSGTFSISSFIVQADDNDAYDLFYRDGAADSWHLAWAVPTLYDYGMQTRPDPTDNTRRYNLASSIFATDLMLTGNPNSDFYYSVSEIQAFGAPVPEPSTIILLGAGLLGVGFLRKRIKN